IRVWELASAKNTATLESEAAITSVAFSGDSQKLAAATADQTVQVWDRNGWDNTGGARREPLTLRHAAAASSIAFRGPESQWVAAGSQDHRITVWDLGTGKEHMTLRGHAGAVTAVASSPDGRRLASVSEDGTVKLWDARNNHELNAVCCGIHEIY